MRVTVGIKSANRFDNWEDAENEMRNRNTFILSGNLCRIATTSVFLCLVYCVHLSKCPVFLRFRNAGTGGDRHDPQQQCHTCQHLPYGISDRFNHQKSDRRRFMLRPRNKTFIYLHDKSTASQPTRRTGHTGRTGRTHLFGEK